MNIVLAHGVIGELIFGGKPYFNGVAAHLRRVFGADVLETKADVKSVAFRSQQLRQQIVDRFGAAPHDPLIIIAHSMGGLDTRQMLTDDPALARHVNSVTCIGTPHHGSPVATLLDAANPLRLFRHAAAGLNAMHDLSEEGAKAIDARCGDHPHIRYREVVGIGRRKAPHTSLVLRVTAKLIAGENDGIVSAASALPPGRTLLERAHADHADLVGHDADDVPDFRPLKFDHLPLYERIVRDATA